MGSSELLVGVSAKIVPLMSWVVPLAWPFVVMLVCRGGGMVENRENGEIRGEKRVECRVLSDCEEGSELKDGKGVWR